MSPVELVVAVNACDLGVSSTRWDWDRNDDIIELEMLFLKLIIDVDINGTIVVDVWPAVDSERDITFLRGLKPPLEHAELRDITLNGP